MNGVRWCAAVLIAMAGCSGGDEAEDGQDDVAIVDGEADGTGIDETSATACPR